MTQDSGLTADVVRRLDEVLLGQAPSLTRLEVAERAGVDPAISGELWRLLGFPNAADDDVAFTDADVEAVRMSRELMDMGIVSLESQAALVRTLARSFARLAEWQTLLLAEVVAGRDDDAVELATRVVPMIERLQGYVWRRHLASATSLLAAHEEAGDERLAVCFVDIVGYTSRSKELSQAELVDWVEQFEEAVSSTVVDHGGHVIKTIGDEVLFVLDDPRAAVDVCLELTERGGDEDDPFPAVRAGVASGDVARRLGDVFGPTVNIAARLTSLARPGSVLVNQGVHDELCADHAPEETRATDLTLRRLRRASVKGYSRLDCWAVRRA